MTAQLESLVERLEHAVARLEGLVEGGAIPAQGVDDDFLLKPSGDRGPSPSAQPKVFEFERIGVPMTARAEVEGIVVHDMNLVVELGNTTLLAELENQGDARHNLQVEAVLRDANGSAFATHTIFFDRLGPGDRNVGDVYMYECPELASLDARVRPQD